MEERDRCDEVDDRRPVRRAARIGTDERTGMLSPDNLARWAARWIAPAPALAAIVDTYWSVEWSLEPGERVEQVVIDAPAVTLTVEEGDVPGPLVVTGPQRRAWRRTIAGTGSVFAVRFRPAGLGVVSDLTPPDLLNQTRLLDAALCPRLHALAAELAATPDVNRAALADQRLAAAATQRPPTRLGLLANDVVDRLQAELRHTVGAELGREVHTSPRQVQRALSVTIGKGPKWVSRRIRLQEVARVLATERDMDLTQLAAELGYTDQAHLTNDFRSMTDRTPAAYRRELHALAGGG